MFRGVIIPAACSTSVTTKTVRSWDKNVYRRFLQDSDADGHKHRYVP
jgi:hypothetical protein